VVPDTVLQRMRRANEKSREHAVAEGIAIAREMLAQVRDTVDGVPGVGAVRQGGPGAAGIRLTRILRYGSVYHHGIVVVGHHNPASHLTPHRLLRMSGAAARRFTPSPGTVAPTVVAPCDTTGAAG
jgi:hypothetical protein